MSTLDAPRPQTGTAPRRQIGVCLIKSNEAHAAFEYITQHCPWVQAQDHGHYFQFETEGIIRIPLDAVAEYLGRPLTMSQFLVCMTTYYGRIASEDDVFILTADMPQLEQPAE